MAGTRRHLFPFLVLFSLHWLLPSCRQSVSQPGASEQVGDNVYRDPGMVRAAEWQNERALDSLLGHLQSEDSRLRAAFCLGLANAQSPKAVGPLLLLARQDSSMAVREAAAFALGQCADTSATEALLALLAQENETSVQAQLMEALGKTGGAAGLAALASLEYDAANLQGTLGQAWGLARCGLRGLCSPEATAKVLELMEAHRPYRVRQAASFYLRRGSAFWEEGLELLLAELLAHEEDPVAQMNLASALGAQPSIRGFDSLNALARDRSKDYRARVSAVAALARYDYEGAKRALFELLLDPNPHVAQRAAEFFVANSRSPDADTYFGFAVQTPHWVTRALMLRAAIAARPAEKRFQDYALAAYRGTDNPHQKADFLLALAGSPLLHPLVWAELAAAKDAPVRTAAVEAMTVMRLHPDFDSLARGTRGPRLDSLFDDYFRRIVALDDPAATSLVAIALRDPRLLAHARRTDRGYLAQAMERCQMPRDFEAWAELNQTLALLENRPARTLPQELPMASLNWETIGPIRQNTRVLIETTKGDFVAELYVNQAPQTVASFLELLGSGYFEGKSFHRVVPNFVVQGGCSRGDGWGALEYAIRTEVSTLRFDTGALGMASAGKDTEGAQWFITHSPTPQLDGRYTVFGQVVSGMEVVHLLEKGDLILGFRFVESPG